MPLDDLQKSVLKILLRRRSPESVFAGGTVIQRHAFRLSDDQDIFHPSEADVPRVAREDMTLLAQHGYTVEVSREHEGLFEAIVGTEKHGFTRIQWVAAGAWNFFKPVPDPEYGWRLHMVDLAVNKVLAAGGRKEVRDYIDLVLVHKHIMPLWHAIWAAPGKDQSWSPVSLGEKIAMTNGFRQEDIDDGILSLVPLSAGKISMTIREAIEEAREIFKRLPEATAGHLFTDKDGNPVNNVDAILAGDATTLSVARNGSWPSTPDVDHLLIQRIVDEFGWEGSRLSAESDEPCP